MVLVARGVEVACKKLSQNAKFTSKKKVGND